MNTTTTKALKEQIKAAQLAQENARRTGTAESYQAATDLVGELLSWLPRTPRR